MDIKSPVHAIGPFTKLLAEFDRIHAVAAAARWLAAVPAALSFCLRCLALKFKHLGRAKLVGTVNTLPFCDSRETPTLIEFKKSVDVGSTLLNPRELCEGTHVI